MEFTNPSTYVRGREPNLVRLAAILIWILMMACPCGSLAQVEFHMMPIRRLAPSTFGQLPISIIRSLEARGCTVPQTWAYDDSTYMDIVRRPHNVVQGSFLKNGQRDWAVLCSCRDSSSILVFWGGKVDHPAELARSRDDDWTQDVDGRGNLGYSRFLGAANPKRILSHNPGLELKHGPLHDAIEDAFVEKGSVLYYFQGDSWKELDGAD